MGSARGPSSFCRYSKEIRQHAIARFADLAGQPLRGLFDSCCNADVQAPRLYAPNHTREVAAVPKMRGEGLVCIIHATVGGPNGGARSPIPNAVAPMPVAPPVAPEALM